jgi:flagellar hook assembly protein FlgD
MAIVAVAISLFQMTVTALPSDGILMMPRMEQSLPQINLTNYPNPFDSRRGQTTIQYTLDQDRRVTIHIYDVFGGKVKTMSFEGGQEGGRQGTNNVYWDGTTSSGSKVSKGIYLCMLEIENSGGSSNTMIKIGVIH